MFLIQYREGCFIDAEKIELIKYTTGGEVRFYTVSDTEYEFIVDKEFTVSFINQLQAINSNPCSGLHNGETQIKVKHENNRI